jgi:4-carboxymuconolactone decarboxylase
MKQNPARIPPLSAAAMSSEQKQLVGPWSSMNFASVMVTHPQLYKTLVPLIAKVISGSDLPPRDREILVLRTLALCGEVYEAHHHSMIARKAGMTDAEIEQASVGGGADLSPFDISLIHAAEELTRDQQVSHTTWDELAQRYSPVELMEVVSLVGVYTLMAMLTKTLGIQLEDAETFENFAKIRKYT